MSDLGGPLLTRLLDAIDGPVSLVLLLAAGALAWALRVVFSQWRADVLLWRERAAELQGRLDKVQEERVVDARQGLLVLSSTATLLHGLGRSQAAGLQEEGSAWIVEAAPTAAGRAVEDSMGVAVARLADVLETGGGGRKNDRGPLEIAADFLRAEERFVGHCYDDADPNARALKPGDACQGTPTIGYGHTGAHARPGASMAIERAEEVLMGDLKPCWQSLADGLDPAVLGRLDRFQQAALLSFVFNVGRAGFMKSTLRHKLNAGDTDAFSVEAPRWKYATVGGKKRVVDGLIKRRAHEVLLWQTPVTQADAEDTITVPVAVDPPPPKPLTESVTLQGVTLSAVGTVVALLLQLMTGMATLPASVQIAMVAAFAVIVVGLLMAFKGRLRIRQRANV